MPWRKAWQLTPVLLPGESPWTEEPGGYIPWDPKESDMAEWLSILNILSWKSLRQQWEQKSHYDTHQSPCERYPPCTRRKEDIIITRNRKFGVEKSLQTNRVKLTLAFPVIFSPFITPSQTPLPCQVFTNVLFLCPKGMKPSCSGHFFGFLFFILLLFLHFSDLLFGITEANQLHYLYHVSFSIKRKFLSLSLHLIY